MPTRFSALLLLTVVLFRGLSWEGEGEDLHVLLCKVLHYEHYATNTCYLYNLKKFKQYFESKLVLFSPVKVGISYVFSCDQKKQKFCLKHDSGPCLDHHWGYHGYDTQM